MYLECTCTNITPEKWDKLMTDAKVTNKAKLNSLVKKEMPELYTALALDLYNPYKYYQTKTHYILVHSAIEYFINKNGG